MTDLLSRPILRVKPTPEPTTRPVALVAGLAGFIAAAVGLIVCISVAVIAWFAADGGSFGSAIRAGTLGWLLANGSGLELSGVSVTAIPLGLTLLTGVLLYLGGRWSGRHSAVRSLADVALGAAAVGGVYALVGMAGLALSRTQAVHGYPLRTAVGSLAVGLAFGGLGVLRGAGMTQRVLDRLPDEVRAAATGGGAGVAVMVAASAALLTASLAHHFSTASTLAGGLHAGLVGGAVMAIAGAAAVPNAVLCAGAFIAGPGFALGTGTSVSPTGAVSLGPLPSFPLLATVPHGASGSAAWIDALLVIPVLAGCVAGFTSLRRFPIAGLAPAVARGGIAGLVFGLAFGSLTWLATGAVGPGRMQDIGPDVLATMAMCVAAGILGGAIAAACFQLMSAPRSRAPSAEGSRSSREGSPSSREGSRSSREGSTSSREGSMIRSVVRGVRHPRSGG